MFYFILILGIFIDLITKYLANVYLKDNINILGDFLYLSLFKNSGIAFSIKVPSLLLKIGTIFLIGSIYYFYIKERKKEQKKFLLDISFGLILAGAIGNGIERVFNSEVIDFIGVKYFSVFNIADSLIFIGAIIYLILSYKKVK